MFRYSAPYKSHYVCFACRKTFKRRLFYDIFRDSKKVEKPAICPQCADVLADMGLDFESPKRKDNKAWKHMGDLYKSGIGFHSSGCHGPGFIPKDKQELISHITGIKDSYVKNKRYWLNVNEIKFDENKFSWKEVFTEEYEAYYSVNPDFVSGTKKKRVVDIDKAINYWTINIEKIEVELIRLNSR